MKFITIITAFLAPMVVMASGNAPEAKEKQDVDSAMIHAMASQKGQLYIRLNSASKLTNKDWFGKSNPYVEMWLDKSYKARSKDTKGLNPVFNETFCFYVRPGQNKLYIRVVDKDTFSNDKIGDTTIKLDQVMSSGSVGPQDYKLPKWFGISDNGSVNMQMQFTPDSS
ncbi:hypothetical protein BGX28_009796 [Mortierella sp. GBA30]|nr:hypothetical protein BGX28_009796 [Mortierella sp. GBA30]